MRMMGRMMIKRRMMKKNDDKVVVEWEGDSQ